MKRRWLAVAAVVAAAAQAKAYPEGDSQLWINLGGETVMQAFRIGVDSGARFGDSMSDYFYQTYEPYILWSGAKWIDVGVACEFVQSKKDGDWNDETIPKLNLTLKGDTGPFQLSNRSRLEHRVREKADDDWRYRDRVRLQWAKGLTEWKLKPFVEDEAYFSFEDREFNENRGSGGIGFELHPRVKGELYFMARSTLKNDEWTDSNIVGTKLAFIF